MIERKWDHGPYGEAIDDRKNLIGAESPNTSADWQTALSHQDSTKMLTAVQGSPKTQSQVPSDHRERSMAGSGIEHDSTSMAVVATKPTSNDNTKITDNRPRREKLYATSSNCNAFKEFEPFVDEDVDEKMKKLHDLYNTRPHKIEEQLKYFELVEPQLNETFFRHKPIVLVIGEVNTGKTSLINFLLGDKKYTGSIVSPERSTNGFSIIDKANKDERVSGRNLVSDPKRPFRELNQFGSDFLENLYHVLVSGAAILENCYIVDTPGIVKGSTKAKDGYEMVDVIKWFANMCDCIILVWDAHSWRMSDAIKELFQECLCNQHRKFCIALSKCDLQHVSRVPVGHTFVEQNSRHVVEMQVIWMVAKFFDSFEMFHLFNVSTVQRPLPSKCDVEMIDIFHDNMMRHFLLLKRHRVQNMVDTVELRLKRCRELIAIIRELQTKLGYFGKEKKKQNVLANLWDFLRDLDVKYLNVHELKKNLEKFDFGNLPKISGNQLTLSIDQSLEEVRRMINSSYLDIEVELPPQYKPSLAKK
ncbi:EH domain-containing protein 3-like [Symsagittifera roscoffensis]|uniref:EH domain-containing protein 3-like n=1 Tax=Symsagittifera roscoffensis TaxID=84072 RepID=UPI00307C4A43